MAEATVVSSRQTAAGKVLFWLLFPVFVAGIVGAMMHYYVPIVNGLGIAFLIYALGTFVVLWMFPSKMVRIPVLILNLGLFVVFGWFQMESFFPAYPWTRYLGAVIVSITWVSIAYVFMSKRGKKKQQPSVQLAHEDNGSLVQKIQRGDVDVKERIIAALKLAGNKGDMTVDAAQILEKMALASEASHIQARANAAQAIIAAFQAGLIPDDLEVNAQMEIATLLRITPLAAETMMEEGTDEGPEEKSVETLDRMLEKMKWT
jgi:anti-sigma28 factor (negative regulator of flagellin synthesis)